MRFLLPVTLLVGQVRWHKRVSVNAETALCRFCQWPETPFGGRKRFLRTTNRSISVKTTTRYPPIYLKDERRGSYPMPSRRQRLAHGMDRRVAGRCLRASCPRAGNHPDRRVAPPTGAAGRPARPARIVTRRAPAAPRPPLARDPRERNALPRHRAHPHRRGGPPTLRSRPRAGTQAPRLARRSLPGKTASSRTT